MIDLHYTALYLDIMKYKINNSLKNGYYYRDCAPTPMEKMKLAENYLE